MASAGVQIDDLAASGSTTYSSTKINAQINTAVTALISGAPGAQDTLAELAGQITALAQADNGLLSFTAAQTLTAPEQAQGGANLGIGDPNHVFVTAIEANLAVGL
jgi:hypothetical protein